MAKTQRAAQILAQASGKLDELLALLDDLETALGEELPDRPESVDDALDKAMVLLTVTSDYLDSIRSALEEGEEA